MRSHDQKYRELARKREVSLAPAGAEAIEKQHARGKRTARERIDALVDAGSFTELDAFVTHRTNAFGLDEKEFLGDGVVTGRATIDGRQIFLFSQDFTVLGGSLGEAYAEKICKVMDLALRTGSPMIGINDSGGARIQEGVVSLGGYAEIFWRNVQASGVIPQLSLIAGPCAGGAVYSPAITDFILMTEKTSQMFITGPEIIKTVTGEDVTFEELGGAMTHAKRSGVAHVVATDEDDLAAQTKTLFSYLPQNNLDDPPRYACDDDPNRENPALDDIVPDSPNKPYDMHAVIEGVLDYGDFFEIQALYAQNIICGFGRIAGASVGIVANQPSVLAGVLDISSSIKAARFVRFCDAFNIPLITFVDVPGFLPGTSQEYGGIILHGAKLLYAFAEATVPKISVIVRKAYGAGLYAMCGPGFEPDATIALPQAMIAVMGAEAAVNAVFANKIAEKPEAERPAYVEELRTQYRADIDVLKLAANLHVDAVVPGDELRAELLHRLATTGSKSVPSLPRRQPVLPV